MEPWEDPQNRKEIKIELRPAKSTISHLKHARPGRRTSEMNQCTNCGELNYYYTTAAGIHPTTNYGIDPPDPPSRQLTNSLLLTTSVAV